MESSLSSKHNAGEELSLEKQLVNVAIYNHEKGIPFFEWPEWAREQIGLINGDIGELKINGDGVIDPESLSRFLQSSLDPQSSNSPAL